MRDEGDDPPPPLQLPCTAAASRLQGAGRSVRLVNAIVGAYSATGAAWQAGPGPIYDRLAEVVVGLSPVPLRGRLVLDVGAGTGAASRAITRVGGRPVALDPAVEMLAHHRVTRPPAVAADALALPVASRSVGGVVAAFSFTHLDDPAAAFREARRVTQPGGPVVVSSFADDDTHPVKEAVDAALASFGWRAPEWHRRLWSHPLVTESGATVHSVRVPFEGLDAAALVAWRLGMAQTAPFVAGLSPVERAALVEDAVRRLGVEWPPLTRSILVVTAVA
jgi:SAM-dependent methyltransferase